MTTKKLTGPKNDHERLTYAYHHFNRTLFQGRLPDNVYITVRHRRGARGYFRRDRFLSRDGDGVVNHELALVSTTFIDRDDKSILSTLAHEMAHLLELVLGTASTGGYHNRKWVGYMEEIGLIPYNVKNPDIQTGTTISHKIEEGGPFDKQADVLLKMGWALEWNEIHIPGVYRVSKVKYECPICGTKAWAKPETLLLCGECSHEADAGDVIFVEMLEA